jgi:hypothetical protein
MSPLTKGPKLIPVRNLGQTTTQTSLPLPYSEGNLPADLTEVVKVWELLPDLVRAGIVAMVKATVAPTRMND